MVIDYFVKHPELLNELFLIMGRKELKFMINFGFWFGVPMGVLIAIVLHFVPSMWTILIGATIVGWFRSFAWRSFCPYSESTRNSYCSVPDNNLPIVSSASLGCAGSRRTSTWILLSGAGIGGSMR